MIIIYISGIDGCGKTTQSQLLTDWLTAQGYEAEYQWLRWEPSVLPLLKRIRNGLGRKSGKKPKAAADTVKKSENESHGAWRNVKASLMKSSLFRYFWMKYASKDYFTAYDKARANWNSNYVVMDRYIFDFVVDQSLNFGVETGDFLKLAESTDLAKMQKPDFSVFINIPAEVGYERKLDGTSLDYLKDREALYNSLDDDNTLHLNGEQTPEEIHAEITEWLAPNLVNNNE